MKMSEKINLLAEALVQAQSEFKPVLKTSENPFYKSKYADIAALKEDTQDALTKHGLAVVQGGGLSSTGQQTLVTLVLHVSGQYLSDEYLLLNAKPNDPQSQGSATSYARRYMYASMLGIVTEDDDGQGATDRAHTSEPAKTISTHSVPFEPKPNQNTKPDDGYPCDVCGTLLTQNKKGDFSCKNWADKSKGQHTYMTPDQMNRFLATQDNIPF